MRVELVPRSSNDTNPVGEEGFADKIAKDSPAGISGITRGCKGLATPGDALGVVTPLFAKIFKI